MFKVNKTPERRHWRLFVVNFEHIVDFEQVNVDWVVPPNIFVVKISSMSIKIWISTIFSNDLNVIPALLII